MSNEDMTIVFIGFDGYADLWNDCVGLFKHFWPDCPYPIVWVNNSKNIHWDGVKVLHAGDDAEWSRKAQLACENITTPYVCLLLEDFLVGSKVDSSTVASTIDMIKKNDINYFKLTNMNRAVKNHDPIYHGISYLHVIPEDDEYGVSLQPAIWKKQFLEDLLGTENYNAWVFEFNRVKEAKGKSNKPRQGCLFDDRNILNLKHGVIQSKYLPGTIRYFQKKGIRLNVQREVMSYPQYYKIRMISKAKYSLPKSLREPVKHILEKMGMKFVSTVRDNN